MRILYCPIMEQGSVHDTAITQKRGLFNALSKRVHVWEWDYLANDVDTLYQGFVNRLNTFDPDMVITQFHAGDLLTPEQIRELRALRPDRIFCNWAGDSWAHSLTAEPILAMAREYDMQLIAAPDALPVYEAAGIRAAYWNIAVETSVVPLPDMPTYDVVFLANVINEKRRVLMERLKAMDSISVGIYGDWEHADGRNVYDFAAGEALYRNATLAIADNVYQDQTNYVSNRPMQALAAGGAMLLHQHVPKMRELTGWVDGEHYEEWQDIDHLQRLIRFWMCDSADERHYIVRRGQKQVLAKHSYDERVRVLFEEFLPLIRREGAKS